MSSISASASMPAYPPPTKTKVSARRRVSLSTVVAATSSRSRTWLRSQIASPMVLKPDRVLAQARDGQRARDRTRARRRCGRTPPRRGGPTIGCTVAVRAACSMRTTSPESTRQRAQLAPQRHDRVAGGDVAGRRLGQERLVGHVRLRVDDRDLGLGRAQLPGQPQRRVEPDVPGTHHEDPLRLHAVNATPDRRQLHSLVTVMQVTPRTDARRVTATRSGGGQQPGQQAGQPDRDDRPDDRPDRRPGPRAVPAPAARPPRPNARPTRVTPAVRPAHRSSTPGATTASEGSTAASVAARVHHVERAGQQRHPARPGRLAEADRADHPQPGRPATATSVTHRVRGSTPTKTAAPEDDRRRPEPGRRCPARSAAARAAWPGAPPRRPSRAPAAGPGCDPAHRRDPHEQPVLDPLRRASRMSQVERRSSAAPVRGAAASRLMSRSTSSRLPAPAQAVTGTPTSRSWPIVLSPLQPPQPLGHDRPL